MLFSVIIPTYNRIALLKRTLASVQAQSCKDYEIIIVDDGSDDATIDYVNSLGNRVQFIQQRNGGPGLARNAGAARATGDYLAFLDSDDLWFPWTLQTFAGLIREYHAPAILSASLLEFREESELDSLKCDPLEVEVFADYLASSRRGFYVGAGASVLKRDEFQKTGGFTSLRINCEDHDLILRMGAAPGFVQILRPATLGYRQHPVAVTQNLLKTYGGCSFLLAQERAGNYPGGVARRAERERILTTHVRPVSMACLGAGKVFLGLSLYLRAWAQNLRMGRLRYQAAFPVLAGVAAVKRLVQPSSESVRPS